MDYHAVERLAYWRDPSSCRECHADALAKWQGSHHALANRAIDWERDASVFRQYGEVWDEAGRQYRFKAEDGELAIMDRSLAGAKPVETAAVVGVIGHTPLQQYLAQFPQGRLQAHSLAWDPAVGELFNVFGEENCQAGEWGQWTGQGMNWNANCAYCYMTDYRKNYDFRTDSYRSERAG